MLVGSGASRFADSMGFVLEPNDNLLTDETQSAYEKFKLTHSVDQTAHDTLCKRNKQSTYSSAGLSLAWQTAIFFIIQGNIVCSISTDTL